MSKPAGPAYEEWLQVAAEGAADLGLAIGAAQLDAHRAHFDLLLARRAEGGLTALSDPIEIAVKHFLDSLSCLLMCEIAPGERVADVGSGAGFPGLVLAAARPLAHYTLIEANQRRAAFLREAVVKLGLSSVAVLPMRAEEAGQHPGHRESYALALSRAVAPLRVLLEYCLPLVQVGGQFVAHKGPDAPQEIQESAKALQALGGRVVRLRQFALPRAMGERILVLVEKTAPTPSRYPRRAGFPAKRPL